MSPTGCVTDIFKQKKPRTAHHFNTHCGKLYRFTLNEKLEWGWAFRPVVGMSASCIGVLGSGPESTPDSSFLPGCTLEGAEVAG